ncbi:hypothetical protein Tsp_04832 [Trichinella spiralis]|uniref:hypothetical protein n=1 Tax=Trichinella spiralis TaxID=6334 RepID=UPI0001EFDFE5|nr:hypothetical protein Tsp_04832 [Trichinella spiralis]
MDSSLIAEWHRIACVRYSWEHIPALNLQIRTSSVHICCLTLVNEACNSCEYGCASAHRIPTDAGLHFTLAQHCHISSEPLAFGRQTLQKCEWNCMLLDTVVFTIIIWEIKKNLSVFGRNNISNDKLLLELVYPSQQ